MALEGMDLELAGSQASQLQTNVVTQLQTAIGNIGTVIGHITANWQGQDAQQFASEWQSTLLPQLNNVHSALDAFHTTFTSNITEQQATSSHL